MVGESVEAFGRRPRAGGDRAVAPTLSSGPGRFTRPAEVAQLVLLLASNTAGNITGADVLIDGGMVTTV